MSKITVYVASPYRIGGQAQNVRTSLKVADELMTKGFAPYAPLLTHFQDMIFPRTEQEWLDIDLEWVLRCDAVLRLPGESMGADGEVKFAEDNGIPVFYSIHELMKWRDTGGKKFVLTQPEYINTNGTN